jgi:serine phosphatase RsbU (regulator of sigma subunit)
LKNVELEQQKEEIEAQAENLREANDEIQKQSIEVQKAYNNIQTISEIGQKVTASLDLTTIIQLVYNNVNLLMDASCFGIGIYQSDTNQLLFQGFIENGETLPTHYENLDMDEKTLAGVCFKEKQPIFINDLAKEIFYYGIELKAQEGALPKSLIYLPLMIEDKTVGVITVQSFKPYAYQETDIDLLAALGSYISVAIENANSYEIIKDNNKHITDSIRYGKTIQEAFLPDATEMKELLGDYFVYYQPKDVVSGDFYWLATTQRGVMVAVVDCTGHGVPGAFMSMIGMSLLHEAVNQKHIESPADILEYLNNEIRNALKQTTTSNRDGMDVCLCRIEKTEDKTHVTFAGAKRSLYYVEQGELFELKGIRKNIGGLQKTEKVFSNQYISVAKDTMLYLTTDGYADQANKEREKFGILTLLALFKQITSLPMQEQLSALKNAMELYQQATSQRDDMTIVGVRI